MLVTELQVYRKIQTRKVFNHIQLINTKKETLEQGLFFYNNKNTLLNV